MKTFFKKINKRNRAFARTLTFTKGKKLVSGFTLVETLVAIAIFTISITALMSVLGSGISNTTYAKTKMTATYLAQEGIEDIRNMRDTYILDQSGWGGFKSKVDFCINSTDKSCLFRLHQIDLCNNDPSTCKLYMKNGYNYDPNGEDSGFVRKIWTEQINEDEMKIFSNVSWTQGAGGSVTFSESLFNWIELPQQ